MQQWFAMQAGIIARMEAAEIGRRQKSRRETVTFLCSFHRFSDVSHGGRQGGTRMPHRDGKP